MQPGEYNIDVGLQEHTEDLLRRLDALPPGAQVRLSVPRDAITMRTLEDYNMLRDLQKRRQIHLMVASPEPTIIGLARIYGFEVENLGGPRRAPVPAEPEGDESLPRFSRTTAPTPPESAWPAYAAAAETAGGGTPDGTNGSAPAPVRPPVPPRPRAGTTRSAATPPPSETDWLFDGTQAADARGLPPSPEPVRSPTPPPDVTLPETIRFTPAAGAAARTPPAPAGPPPVPAAPVVADDELGDLANLNFDADELDAQSAEYTRTMAEQATARARDSAANGAPAGGRTFVDHSRSSQTPATVLGAGAAGSLERRPAPTPPSNQERAGSSSQPLNGRSGAHLDPAGASAAGADGAVAPPITRRPIPARTPARTQRRSNLLPLAGILLLLLGILIIFLWPRPDGTNGILPIIVAPTAVPNTVTITLQPRTTGDLGPIKVEVPILIGGTAQGRAGLAAPVFPLTGTLPLTGTVPLTGTTPGAIDDNAPRTAQPVQAQKILAPITATRSIATTGVRQQPNKSAFGTIEFTNQGAAAIGIPAGTKVTATNGKRFHTVRAITIPGTNFIAHTFGVRDVDIQADAPGPDYNGARLSGSYGDAVFVSLGATGGGDTIPVKTVAAKDLTDLQFQLKADIDTRAGKTILAQVPPALTAITCTVVGPSAYQVGPLPDVGKDADNIGGVMTATAAVYAFAPAEVRHHAALAVQAIVPGDLPAGVQAVVDPASIPEGTLPLTRVSNCDGGRVQYETTIAARLVYTVTGDSTLAAQIKDQVRGKAQPDARAAIMALPLGPYLTDVQFAESNPAPATPGTEPVLPADPAHIVVLLPGGAPATGGGDGGGATPADAGSATPSAEPK